MRRKMAKKEKTYICAVCGKTKKAKTKIRCCGRSMVSKDRGSWNL